MVQAGLTITYAEFLLNFITKPNLYYRLFVNFTQSYFRSRQKTIGQKSYSVSENLDIIPIVKGFPIAFHSVVRWSGLRAVVTCTINQ
jgi:hypothetical protein